MGTRPAIEFVEALKRGVPRLWTFGSGLVERARRVGARRKAELRSRHVVVFARDTQGWQALEGQIGRGGLRVLRTATLAAGQDWRARLRSRGFPEGAQAILVVSSRRFVCRELDLPAASEDEIEHMVGLRLETELPYDVSETTWAWHSRSDADQPGTMRTVLVAVPSADIAQAERDLANLEQRYHDVECREAALAQLAVILAPDAESAALAEIDATGAALVVTRAGRMVYARTMSAAAGDSIGARLAGEIHQSLQHYALDRDCHPPDKVLLLGESKMVASVLGALTQTTSLPVVIAEQPEWLRAAGWPARPENTFHRFAPCIGALVAADRRLSGEEVAAPPLRVPAPPRQMRALRRRGLLAAVVAVLLAAVVYAGFAVRAAKLQAASEAIRTARSALGAPETIEEEVRILQYESDRHRSTLELLLAMMEALPSGIVLGEVTIDSRGNVTISGKAPSVEVAAKAALALDASGEFTQSQFLRGATGKEGLMFKITCSVREG